MPSAQKHIGQAQHNESLASTLLKQGMVSYSDWIVTMIFYAAVHYVDHYFMRTAGVAPKDHWTRSEYVRKDAGAKRVAFELDNLRNLSQQARYYCVYPAAAKVQDLLDNDLQRIKSIVTTSTR